TGIRFLITAYPSTDKELCLSSFRYPPYLYYLKPSRAVPDQSGWKHRQRLLFMCGFLSFTLTTLLIFIKLLKFG
ncbi:MAG TPA: hypothetical protein VJC03_01090, partial [bacterium]|nr:hypothetical protein [bacterium]